MPGNKPVSCAAAAIIVVPWLILAALGMGWIYNALAGKAAPP